MTYQPCSPAYLRLKPSIRFALEFLEKDKSCQDRAKLSAEQVCDLLELCLNTTYLAYNGKYYKQCHGCAMGSPVSPVVVNLFMERFEYTALNGTPS